MNDDRWKIYRRMDDKCIDGWMEGQNVAFKQWETLFLFFLFSTLLPAWKTLFFKFGNIKKRKKKKSSSVKLDSIHSVTEPQIYTISKMKFESTDKFLFWVPLRQLSTPSWAVGLQLSPPQLVPNLNVTLHRYNVLKYSHILFNTSISHCGGAISCQKRLNTINQTHSIGVFAAALHADCKSVLNQHPALFDFAFFLKIFFLLFYYLK